MLAVLLLVYPQRTIVIRSLGCVSAKIKNAPAEVAERLNSRLVLTAPQHISVHPMCIRPVCFCRNCGEALLLNKTFR
jgi:hypothetical protein